MSDLSLLISAVGVFVSGFGAWTTILFNRIRSVERKLSQTQTYNRRLWEWSVRHLELYYRWRMDGSPEPDKIPNELDVD